MIEHKYDIGDTVKWYMKRINDEGALEIDKEYGPATGVIKEIITDQHLIKSFFETGFFEKVGTEEEEEPIYGVYVDWNSPCFKHNSYKDTSINEDEDSPMPLCLMKESEIFM